MIDWLKNKLIPKYKPNEKEQLILDIVTNLCEQSDTDIKMAPISGRYFLVNKRLEYWVRLWRKVSQSQIINSHLQIHLYNHFRQL